jgi:hypothetical protein
MAIFGIGAYFNKDVSAEFIRHSIIGISWNIKTASDIHEYIKSLKVGDIIYIKSDPVGAVFSVKAIGIISDSEILDTHSFGCLVQTGRHVKWVSTQEFNIKCNEGKNDVKANTIYEEFSPEIQKRILKEFKFIK